MSDSVPTSQPDRSKTIDTHTHIRTHKHSAAGGATYKPLVERDEGDKGAERFVAVYLRQWGAHLLSEVTAGEGGGSRRRRRPQVVVRREVEGREH